MKLIVAQDLELPSGVPFDEGQAALEHLLSAGQERNEGLRRDAESSRSVVDAHQYRLRELAGEEGFARMRRLREEREAPSGLDSASAIDERRAYLRGQTVELLRELKIDPDELRSLNRQLRDEFEQAIPAPAADGTFVVADLGSLGGLGTPGPLVVSMPYRPPFPNTNSFFDGWVERAFAVEKTFRLNAQSGEVGTRLRLDNGDASNGDLAECECNASVLFEHTMPKNGRLQIVVDAECLHSGHLLTWVDEWGVSSAFSWQQNWLVAKADGLASDPWQRVLMSTWQASGDEEGTWQHHPIPVGEVRQVTLNTENWFPKDSRVMIQVGTTTWHRAFTDDMEFYSEVDFAWRIHKVTVTTVD